MTIHDLHAKVKQGDEEARFLFKAFAEAHFIDLLNAAERHGCECTCAVPTLFELREVVADCQEVPEV